jgi:5-methylcytosine-specific restriction endonuclease McrA
MTEALHARALRIAARYKEAEADLLSVIQEVDREEAYMDHGYASLIRYVIGALGLSESVALNFVTVARKSVEAPDLKEAIALGKLGVAKARKITPVLTAENQKEWVAKAISLPQSELERAVARALPAGTVAERMKFVAPERLELKLGISTDLREKLRRVQDLESQRLSRAVSIEEAIEVMAALYIRAKDPLEKAKRAEIKAAPDASAPVVRQAASVPASQAHRARLRDDGRCTYFEPDGSRCPSRRWLDLHHIRPKSAGGPHVSANLRTLCQGHHRLLHRVPGGILTAQPRLHGSR